ncbi:MAG: shikimate dehydrogenase [Clostridia bacterium]|nr:shikimate dehydrogenase [Clostridia bacterium]
MSKTYRSQLVGCFGDPVDENPTGVMEEAAFAAAGVDFRYLTMRVEAGKLGDAFAGIRAMNFRGINLTIPHKVEGLKYMDSLSRAAQIIGAVNMVVIEDGKTFGENTDGRGYLMSLEQAGIDIRGKNLTVLGAGGAARAICVESALAGAAKVTVINRSEERGEELAALIREKTDAEAVYLPWTAGMAVPADTDILANATSIGLFPNVDQKPEIDYDSVTKDMVVTDVIFNDPNSLFLQESAKRGAKTIDGLGMLINQGALNFKLWTGVDPSYEVMRAVLMKEFGLDG